MEISDSFFQSSSIIIHAFITNKYNKISANVSICENHSLNNLLKGACTLSITILNLKNMYCLNYLVLNLFCILCSIDCSLKILCFVILNSFFCFIYLFVLLLILISLTNFIFRFKKMKVCIAFSRRKEKYFRWTCICFLDFC